MAFECHKIVHRFDFFCLCEVDYAMISIVQQKEKKKRKKRKRKKKRRIVQIRSNKINKIRQHNKVEYSMILFNVI